MLSCYRVIACCGFLCVLYMNYHEDSDWDLLLLLDKPKLEHGDFDKYSYPFVLMGWDFGEDIRPQAYTKDEWFNGPHAMFYYNVEEDKEILFES